MQLLTVKETASKLKISISMVYRLIVTGELPAYEIGACKRIDMSDLARFLDSKRKSVAKLPQNKRRHF